MSSGYVLAARSAAHRERSTPWPSPPRRLATAASVDPALVLHYFGNKDDIFAAALALPIDPSPAIPMLLAIDPASAGERTTRAFLGLWEDLGERSAYMAIVRCGALLCGSCAARQDRTCTEHARDTAREDAGPPSDRPLST